MIAVRYIHLPLSAVSESVMSRVPRCDNIFWLLLICFHSSKDTLCSLASQDLYTEDIRPSINTDVFKSSDITQTSRPSISLDGILSSAIAGSTLSHKNPEEKHSSILETPWLSIHADYMTFFPTLFSTSSSGIESFPVLTSQRFSISPDKTSSLADTTQLSTTYDVTFTTGPDTTQLPTTYDVASSTGPDTTQLPTTSDVASSTGQDTTVLAPATKCCRSVTGSTYLLLGEVLVLTCSLSDQDLGDYTARNISFRHSCPSQLNSQWECVSQSSVQIIDEKTAKMIISNVTFHDVGQYTCLAGDTFCQFGHNKTQLYIIGFADDVNIEYAPHNVTHFKCEVYNWDEYMTCTWEHPVQYKTWSNIEVTSWYSTNGLNPNMVCPKPEDTGCFWDDFPSGATYKIQVNVTNKPKQQTASTTFTVNAIKHVKPGPIEDLTIVPSVGRTGCLLISWKHPRVNRSKVYTVKHKVVGHGEFTVLIEDFGNESYISCGYDPYTHHNFSVECLPAGVYFGYFSEPVFSDVWTPETEPDLGPTATNGSFASTPCTDGLRNVTLMWQAVNQTARHGNITGYLIQSGQDNLTSTDAGIYSATVTLSCDSVSVAIFAINKAGLSVSPTILLVSTATVSTQVQNSFVVEIKGVMQASWEDTDEVNGDVDYTIFWCKGRLEQSCEDEIHWREVPTGHTEFVVPVESSNPGEYIYGISARNVQTGIASQLFWTPCLFTRNPPQLPTVNAMNVKALQDSVYITWSADTCNYQNLVKYTSFVVKWCRTAACHEPGRISNATVQVGESTYTVASLPAGVNYSFTVQPMSYDTPGREVDPWKIAVPSATDQDPRLRLAAVLGGLASAAVVLVLVAILCTYCQRRKIKIKKLGNTHILDFQTVIVQELGPPVLEVTSARDQQQYPAFTPVNASMSLSDELESRIRSTSKNRNRTLIREELDVCNNGQSEGSRQSEPDSPEAAGYFLQASLQSSEVEPLARPPSNGYSRFIGSGSTLEVCSDGQDHGPGQSEQDSTIDHGYISHPDGQSSENAHTRPPSNGYSRFIGSDSKREVCSDGQDQGSGKSEEDSTIDHGYIQHPDGQSSENAHTRPPSNDYSRFTGSDSKREVCSDGQDQGSGKSEEDSTIDHGYIQHPDGQSSENAHTIPPSNDYSRFTGSDSIREVCSDGQDQGSGKSEQDSTTDHGYISHPDRQSSENTHTRPPSNDYIRVAGNEPEICNNAEVHTSRQSEQESTFGEPGYMPQNDLQSSENVSIRPPSIDYIRVVGNEPEICNNDEDHTSIQSEQDLIWTDPGYMPLPILQSSDAALHTGNGDITGTLPQSTPFTIVPNSYVLYTNALFDNYSQEEETHSRQTAIASSMDLRDGYITFGVPCEETRV